MKEIMNNKDTKVLELKLGELFSGPGGLALGAKNSISINSNKILKIKHTWANDIDPSSCKTYSYNICGDENTNSVICKDVRELNIKSLPEIDVFAYGFPCNDFSLVGEQKGITGKFGSLYYYGIEVINHFKPKVFVAENVGGINSANEGKTFRTILNELKNSGNGYNITVHLYKSEDYGVPQTRHRYIIVGIDKTLNLTFKVPRPTHSNNYVTVKEALANIPESISNNEFTKVSNIVIERLKYIKPGENAWTANIPEHLKLNVKSAKMSQIYKRLDAEKPSYTITGSGGGGTHGYHYNEDRPLTNRERARIQTFPDNYLFKGSKEEVRKQIGMAVPPKLSEVIFTSILNTLNKVDYPSIQENFTFEYEMNKFN